MLKICFSSTIDEMVRKEIQYNTTSYPSTEVLRLYKEITKELLVVVNEVPV